MTNKPFKNREQRKQEIKIQTFLLSLVNEFLIFFKLNENDLQAVDSKLDELDRKWRMYTIKFNHNPANKITLRPNDFMAIIAEQLKKIENERNKNTSD